MIERPEPALKSARVMTRVRYRVLAMAVALAFITYLDRVCISITAPQIMHDLRLTPLAMSFVFSAFTTAYALFEIPTGWWGDRVGTRRVLTRIVLWWSTFTALTAGAWNFASLLAVRFLFGIGEAGAWPNVAGTFSRWFPKQERGTAQGIFFMGAHIGGGLTPLLVAAVLAHLPWRAVFVIFAGTGVLWAALWRHWFRDEPRQHPEVSEAEAEWIEQGRVLRGHAAEHALGVALRNPSVWFLCLMYFTQTYGFTFYVTWLPTYLQRDRHLSGLMLTILAGAPLLLSAVADLAGGLLTDSLTKRFDARMGRCVVGGASLILAAVCLTIGATAPLAWFAGLSIAAAAMWSNFLLGASWGACVDIAGANAGAVSAAMNTAGQVGGVLSPIVYAVVTRNGAHSAAALLITAGLYLLGGLCWAGVHPERVSSPSASLPAHRQPA